MRVWQYLVRGLMLSLFFLLKAASPFTYIFSILPWDHMVNLPCHGDGSVGPCPHSRVHEWTFNGSYIGSFQCSNGVIPNDWSNILAGNFTTLSVLNPPRGKYCCTLRDRYEECFGVGLESYVHQLGAHDRNVYEETTSAPSLPFSIMPSNPGEFVLLVFLFVCMFLGAYLLYRIRRLYVTNQESFSYVQFTNSPE
ncbi:E3 gp19K [Titi monkey adenovirus ECC-2011]|uniref:E3 gp19K n=1 Tax=titi monkey adenovirus 1 TaxID=3123084 RepID=G0ZAJ3_9ADEN|nr:E3 gp19K [Titi monkey adenovirus ECC-2011]AEK98464.1 E3 gp19K [Titi monkey adenovirus ECC-2011]